MFAAYDPQSWNDHPLVKKIPWNIWVEHFQYSISDEELVRLDDSIEKASIPLVASENPLKAYLALVSAHYGHIDVTLVAAARCMGVPLSIRIAVAAITRWNGVLCIISEEERQLLSESIKAYERFAIKTAINNGCFGLVTNLLNLLSDQDAIELIADDNFRLIHLAASQGSLAMFNFLKSKLPKERISDVLCSEGFAVFHEVLQAENVIAFQELVDLAKSYPGLLSKMVTAGDYNILFSATNPKSELAMILVLQLIGPNASKLLLNKGEMLFKKSFSKQNDFVSRFLLLHAPIFYKVISSIEDKSGGLYEFIVNFVCKKMDEWKMLQSDFKPSHPYDRFKFITVNEQMLGIYIFRFLIINANNPRFQQRDLLSDFRFLLSLPEIVARIYKPNPFGEVNYILHLAQYFKLFELCSIMLDIPEILSTELEHLKNQVQSPGLLDSRLPDDNQAIAASSNDLPQANVSSSSFFADTSARTRAFRSFTEQLPDAKRPHN